MTEWHKWHNSAIQWLFLTIQLTFRSWNGMASYCDHLWLKISYRKLYDNLMGNMLTIQPHLGTFLQSFVHQNYIVDFIFIFIVNLRNVDFWQNSYYVCKTAMRINKSMYKNFSNYYFTLYTCKVPFNGEFSKHGIDVRVRHF